MAANISQGDLIKKSWEMVKGDLVFFIVGFLVTFLVGYVTLGILMGPLMVGFVMAIFKKMNIQARLQSGFMAVAAIVLMVGGGGYFALNSVAQSIQEIGEISPVVDVAADMRSSINESLQGLQGIETAQQIPAVEDQWASMTALMSRFDTLYRAAIDGGSIHGSTVVAVADEEVIALFNDAFGQFEDSFQPAAQGLYDVAKERLITQSALENAELGSDSYWELDASLMALDGRMGGELVHRLACR